MKRFMALENPRVDDQSPKTDKATGGSKLFVRVLYEGTLVPRFNWMPIDEFIEVLIENVPEDLVESCRV